MKSSKWSLKSVIFLSFGVTRFRRLALKDGVEIVRSSQSVRTLYYTAGDGKQRSVAPDGGPKFRALDRSGDDGDDRPRLRPGGAHRRPRLLGIHAALPASRLGRARPGGNLARDA